MLVQQMNHVLWTELFAVHSGLLLAASKEIWMLWITLHSKFVMDILKAKIKSPWRMKTISRKIECLLANFVDVEISHVWREANQPTDILASLASGPNEIIFSA